MLAWRVRPEAPTDHTNRYRDRVKRWSVGAPEGVGGGELRRVESISRLLSTVAR